MQQVYNLSDLGDKTLNLISNYMVLSDLDKRKALYWIASVHLRCFDRAQLLMILAPEGGCGKSRLRRILSWCVPNPSTSVSASPAWVYTVRTLGQHEEITIPLFLDEMGKYYNGKKDTSEMTAILCGGADRGEKVTRARFDKNGKRDVEQLDTFGPKVILGIQNETQGFFPADLLRRAHIINLPKRRSDEKLKRFITRDVKSECGKPREEFERWANPRRDIAKDWLPTLPIEIEDSLFDKTEPLVTTGRMLDITDHNISAFIENVTGVTRVTDVTAVGRWEKQVLKDALSELDDVEDKETSDGVQLLRDCINVVNEQTEYDFFMNTKVPSTANDTFNWGLYSAVMALPEAKWSTYNYGGKPLSQTQFWDMLKKRGVKRPGGGTVRIGRGAAKGVDLSAFLDPASRYCPDITPARNAVTPVTAVTQVTPENELSDDDRRIW
jgi:hypothetical protein